MNHPAQQDATRPLTASLGFAAPVSASQNATALHVTSLNESKHSKTRIVE